MFRLMLVCRRIRPHPVLLTLAVLYYRAALAAPVSDASQICSPTADPCVVSSAVVVSDGAVLDFGPRELRLTATGRLDVGSGTMSISCGSLRVDLSGQILAKGGTTAKGGNVSIATQSDLSIAGVINVSGAPGGSMSLNAGGTIGLSGGVATTADGTTSSSVGGAITMTADTFAINAPISATGGGGSRGGRVSIAGIHMVTITNSVNVSGGERGSGSIDISSGGDVVMGGGTLRADASTGGSARSITVTAGHATLGNGDGSLMLSGVISANGGSNTVDGGGDGGSVTLAASHDCQIDANVSAISGLPDASGGSIVITCGTSADKVAAITGQLDTGGTGSGSSGGDISVDVSGALSLSGSLFARSGRGADAGSIEISSGGASTLTPTADLRVDASGSGYAGSISITAGTTLTNGGKLSAVGGSDPEGGGNGGTIELTAAGTCQIGGSMTATSGAPDASGGSVDLSCGTKLEHDTTVTSTIDVSGAGSGSSGGTITIDGSGPLSMSGTLLAKGGTDADGGEISVTADGTTVLPGTVRVDGAGSGWAGAVTIGSGDRLSITGTVSAIGGTAVAGAGNGGSIDLSAPNGCQINGKISAASGRPDGGGGDISVDSSRAGSGGIEISATVDASGQGAGSGGGSIALNSSGPVTVQAQLDARGVAHGGGSIRIAAVGPVVIAAPVLVSGSGGAAGRANLSSSGATLTMTDGGTIAADTDAGNNGGKLFLTACVLAVGNGARATAAGLAGSITVTGVNALTIAGMLSADAVTGSIDLETRDGPPVIQSSASIEPAPRVLPLDPSFPGCESLRPTPTTTATSTPTRSPTRTATPTRSATSRPSATSSPTATSSPIPTSTPTLPPQPAGPGDANCDGRIDAADLQRLAQDLFDPSLADQCGFADSNEDGAISAADFAVPHSARDAARLP